MIRQALPWALGAAVVTVLYPRLFLPLLTLGPVQYAVDRASTVLTAYPGTPPDREDLIWKPATVTFPTGDLNTLKVPLSASELALYEREPAIRR